MVKTYTTIDARNSFSKPSYSCLGMATGMGLGHEKHPANPTQEKSHSHSINLLKFVKHCFYCLIDKYCDACYINICTDIVITAIVPLQLKIKQKKKIITTLEMKREAKYGKTHKCEIFET